MTSTLAIPQAQDLLATFSCDQPKAITSEAERLQVQIAIKLLTTVSDYQLLGVLADRYTTGWTALTDYLQALGYDIPEPPPTLAGPVYLKFNALSQACHSDAYTGDHRGVLISYQSYGDDQLNAMYGHFPLTLFSGPVTNG